MKKKDIIIGETYMFMAPNSKYDNPAKGKVLRIGWGITGTWWGGRGGVSNRNSARTLKDEVIHFGKSTGKPAIVENKGYVLYKIEGKAGMAKSHPYRCAPTSHVQKLWAQHETDERAKAEDKKVAAKIREEFVAERMARCTRAQAELSDRLGITCTIDEGYDNPNGIKLDLDQCDLLFEALAGLT